MAKTSPRTAAARLAHWKGAERLEAAAKKLGISGPYLHQLIHGRRRAGIEVAARIERLTGIPARLWAEQTVERMTKKNFGPAASPTLGAMAQQERP